MAGIDEAAVVQERPALFRDQRHYGGDLARPVAAAYVQPAFLRRAAASGPLRNLGRYLGVAALRTAAAALPGHKRVPWKRTCANWRIWHEQTAAKGVKRGKWRAWRDSNPRPLASEATTLSG